jgi:hypothetical protein
LVPCTFQAAAAAIGEARDIADLRCQPLLDRAADITPAQSHVADEITPLPIRKNPMARRVSFRS